MRAVIVEKRGRRAAALAEDGTVHLIPDTGHAVGEQILLPRRTRRRWKKPLTWAACIAVLCAVATTGVYAAYEPCTYVSLGTGSTVEYTLNRFDQVLDVRPLAADSVDLARALRKNVPKFTHIDRAMADAVDAMYRDGSLTGQKDDFMLVTVSSKEESKGHALKEHLGAALSAERPDGKPQPPAAVVRGPAPGHDGPAPRGAPPDR